MTEESKNPDNSEISGETNEEVSAAVEELKAAQAKLDEARAKVDAIKNDNPPLSYTEDAVTAQEETVVVIEEIELEAQPVEETASADQGQPSVEQPNWTPYEATSGTYTEQSAAAQGGNSQNTVPPQTPAQDSSQQTYYQQPPQQTYQQSQQQYYYQQQQQYPTQQTIAPKDHVAAGLLGIFLGGLGIHKFYLGYNTSGFIMLAVAILGGVITCSLATWVMWIIGIIEGILYLTKSQGEFEQIYVFNKREWF